MKASVAFVLLAFLSATTAKVHVQNRKASEVNSKLQYYKESVLFDAITGYYGTANGSKVTTTT